MSQFRRLSGLANWLEMTTLAYDNVKPDQRLFLPGYAKKHRHPQWRPNKDQCEWFVKSTKQQSHFSFISHSLCHCPLQLSQRWLNWGPVRVWPAPGHDRWGTFPCLLIRAENPEIRPLHVIIQHRSTDGNNESQSEIACFSLLAPSFLSYLVDEDQKKGGSWWDSWSFQNLQKICRRNWLCCLVIESVTPLYLIP